jgi:hypothetical protein
MKRGVSGDDREQELVRAAIVECVPFDHAPSSEGRAALLAYLRGL